MTGKKNKPFRMAAMLAVFLAAGASVQAAAPDTKSTTIIADFEGDSYAPWIVEGKAFGEAPSRSVPPGQHLVGFRGRGMANSIVGGGDGATGRLTSPEFVIRRPIIAFLIGGGNHPLGEAQTVNIHLLIEGKAVRSATGRDSDSMEWVNWNVAEFAGKTGQLVIEDTCTGGWGHIEVDQVVFASVTMPAFSLASPFADHMVLQRERPVTVWGTALAGQRVRVGFAGQAKETTTDERRHWRVTLDPLPASPEPRALVAESLGESAERLEFADVLVGEVWLASGQSNMGMPVRDCIDGSNLVANTSLPTLRFLQVPCRADRVAQENFAPVPWKPATPKDVGNFGGVAFFFARQLCERLQVPVGVIQSAFGGTPAEAWTSPEGLSRVSQFKQAMDDDLARIAKLDADPATAKAPHRLSLPFAAAGGLFNAMINPLIPFTIRGVIWYQGESNAFRADQYAQLLPLMIADWRARFGQGDFPFYLVQLANYYDPLKEPAPTDKRTTDDWVARLREAQSQVVRTVPNTAMAVAIDVGEKSIHPLNKQDVGDRLARLALARTYGLKDVEHASPVYVSMKREGATIRVKFTGCPGGLMAAAKTGLDPARETPDAKLAQFAIAGADRKFVWAEASLGGKDAVIVSSPVVAGPVAVRYAWGLNPAGANLYGRNGLPASPFRTDDWPLPVK